MEFWRAWRAEVEDIDSVDRGSHRLLPLIYLRLRKEGATGDDVARLRSIHRYYQARNHFLFSEVSPLLFELRPAGIETVILKGAALATRYYEDPGARPMDDVDVLIHPSQLHGAIQLLRRSGWSGPSPKRLSLDSRTHAFVFEGPTGEHVDLHWYSLRDCRWPAIDDGLWNRSVPGELCGAPTRFLDTTDCLFHVLGHGAKKHAVFSSWVADALVILTNSAVSIEWDHLLRLAEEYRLSRPILECLDFLQHPMGFDVPSDALEQLLGMPVSLADRAYFRISQDEPRTLFGTFLWLWVNYLRFRRPRGLWRTVCGFPQYLQDRWGLERLRELPRAILTHILDELRLRLRS